MSQLLKGYMLTCLKKKNKESKKEQWKSYQCPQMSPKEAKRLDKPRVTKQ